MANHVTAAWALCIAACAGSAAAQDDTPPTAADTQVGRMLEAPVNTLPVEQKFWWSDA